MRATIAAVGVFLLFGCAQSNTNAPAPDLKSQIDANDAAWSAAANRGDAAAIAAMYTETATMLPPGMPIQKGRAAIEKTAATLEKAGIRNLTLTAIDVSQVGPDTAREIGQYTLDAPGPRKKFVKVDGKYVVIWKLVGGKWLLDVDIWNPNK
jgi:uncharacterized protein (TIGR02246 family)